MGADNLFLKSVSKMFDDAVEILGVEPGWQNKLNLVTVHIQLDLG